MPDLYRIENLTVSYGSATVLDIKLLEIGADRLHVLTGANGAGKSTLLNVLALLTPPATGTVSFAGSPVHWERYSLFKLRREVTLVQQSPYLFSGSVEENVAYGLQVRGVSAAVRKQRIEEALAATNLTSLGKRDALQLSGGEARRVAVARALALKPKALLLDEPLANVDQESSSLLEALITSLPAQGISVIMTTHEPDHALRLGSARIHLVSGRVIPAEASTDRYPTDGCATGEPAGPMAADKKDAPHQVRTLPKAGRVGAD